MLEILSILNKVDKEQLGYLANKLDYYLKCLNDNNVSIDEVDAIGQDVMQTIDKCGPDLQKLLNLYFKVVNK